MKVIFSIQSLFLVATLMASCMGQIFQEKLALFIDVWRCHAFIEQGLIYVNNDTYSAQGITSELCEMDVLRESVACLYNVSRKWRSNNVQLEVLHQLANPDRWRKEIRHFCESLPGYSHEDDCVNGLQPTIKSCLSANKGAFDREVNHYTHGEIDKIMLTMCLYYEGNRRCTANPIMDFCDRNLANILGGLIHSYMPLICNHPSKLKSLLLMAPSISTSPPGPHHSYILIMITVTWTLGKYLNSL